MNVSVSAMSQASGRRVNVLPMMHQRTTLTLTQFLSSPAELVERSFTALKTSSSVRFTTAQPFMCVAYFILNATKNKKAQLTLSNQRDVKACKNCSNSTCFVSFPFPEFQNLGLGLYSYTQFEIWCLPIIKLLVQITST